MSLAFPILIPAAFCSGTGPNKGTLNTLGTVAAGVLSSPAASPAASLADGFPAIDMANPNAGGVAPAGGDFNALFNYITAFQAWVNAGGQFPFNAALAAAIGGYQIGNVVQLNTGLGGVVCTTANNVQDPNAAMTGWAPYSGSLMASLTSLASQINAGQGAGLVGYNSSLGYTAGTVGYTLNNAPTITAVGAYIVAQTATGFTTTGTGAAYIGTPASPATNAAGQRVNATFALAGTVLAPTIAISGQAAMPLVQLNAAGALVACVPTLNLNSDLISNGTQWVVQTPPPAKSTTSGGRFKNLIVTYGQSSGTVTIVADEVTVEDTAGNQTRLQGVFVSAALSTIGAINGTDGSTLTAGNMYTVWVAYNPTTGAVGALISAEPTSPTMALLGPVTPVSGYTQYACVSINKIKALAPAYWQPAVQRGNRITWTLGTYLTATPVVVAGATGSVTTPTYTSETVAGNGNLIPYHSAVVILLYSSVDATAEMIAAPNTTGYGADATGTIPPYMQFNANSTYGGMSYVPCDMLLESATIGVAQTAGTMFCVGAVLSL